MLKLEISLEFQQNLSDTTVFIQTQQLVAFVWLSHQLLPQFPFLSIFFSPSFMCIPTEEISLQVPISHS